MKRGVKIKGDIVFIRREPLIFKSPKARLDEESSPLDGIIARFVYYKHYGIEVEEDKIVHFYCPGILKTKSALVRETTKEEFARSSGKIEYQIKTEKFLNNEVIAVRAKEMIGKNFGGYRISNNNCEHFALWCSTGEKESHQKPKMAFYLSFMYMFGQLGDLFLELNIISKIIEKSKL